MNFTQVVEVVRKNQEDYRPLRLMLDWLKSGKGFLFTRFNDGESICALGLRPPEERNNCGHLYLTDLGGNLLRLLTEIRDTMKVSKDVRILLGGYWYTQGSKFSDLDSAALALVRHLGASEMQAGALLQYPWVGSDDLVRGLISEPCLPLRIFDHIRESGRPVYLVCNPRNEPGRHCLGAKCIPISRIDCWKDTPRVLAVCRTLARSQEPAIFVWCCGMSKTWAWDIWKEYPQTSHLDAGHLFDACFGEYSRSYTRRRNRTEPTWAAYEDKFEPFCKRHIPAGVR